MNSWIHDIRCYIRSNINRYSFHINGSMCHTVYAKYKILGNIINVLSHIMIHLCFPLHVSMFYT